MMESSPSLSLLPPPFSLHLPALCLSVCWTHSFLKGKSFIHSRRHGTVSSRLHQPKSATPEEKEDFSLPEPTYKIQGRNTNKPNVGHVTTTEPIAMLSQGAWATMIDPAVVTWHPLAPLEPDVMKEKSFPKEGSGCWAKWRGGSRWEMSVISERMKRKAIAIQKKTQGRLLPKGS